MACLALTPHEKQGGSSGCVMQFPALSPRYWLKIIHKSTAVPDNLILLTLLLQCFVTKTHLLLTLRGVKSWFQQIEFYFAPSRAEWNLMVVGRLKAKLHLQRRQTFNLYDEELQFSLKQAENVVLLLGKSFPARAGLCWAQCGVGWPVGTWHCVEGSQQSSAKIRCCSHCCLSPHSCFLCDRANNAVRSDVVGTMTAVFLCCKCSFLRALLAVSEHNRCTVVYLNGLLKHWGRNRTLLCRCHKGTGDAVWVLTLSHTGRCSFLLSSPHYFFLHSLVQNQGIQHKLMLYQLQGDFCLSPFPQSHMGN